MEEITLASKILFNVGPIVITNSMMASWAAILVLILLSFFATKKLSKIPKGLQNIMEFVVESLLGLIESVTIDKAKARKFFPWITTFFLLILVSNWMELIPGFGSIGLHVTEHGKTELVPLLRSANTDLNTTLSFAIISVFMVQVFGIASVGFFKYVGKFINFKGPINFFVGILELISEIAKMISFSFRLFGNIFAGEVLLVVIMFLIPYVVPVPFYAMELFVGFIQALVFAMLTLVFMTMATTSHEH
ncbi:MAG: hypothetical protein ACD_58C00110G0004 [uncultured bacterium]|nr:MAG: hypothetical protein ACD_58C00110G0004 [uncultured bacterium]